MTMDEDEEILGTGSSGPLECILAMRLHLTRPVEPIIYAGQTSVALEGAFERSMSAFREQAADLGVEIVSDINEANIILSNGTESTYTGEGTVLTLRQWDALVNL